MSGQERRRSLISVSINLLVGVVVALLAIGIGWIILLTWGASSLRAHQEDQQEWDRERMRRTAELIGRQLAADNRDGQLTDVEIDKAVLRYDWHADRTRNMLQIVVRIDSSTPVGDRCYTYTFPSPKEQPQTESPACPEARPHRELRTT